MAKEFTPEIRAKLRADFPPEAYSVHESKSFLSTLKAMYVVERLNDVFGICKWDIEHEIVEDSQDYVSIKGRLVLKEYDIKTPTQYGGHKKTGKNTEPADGYKSAVTDLLSKCASYLEIGIDLFKGLVNVNGQDRKPPRQTNKKQVEPCPKCKKVDSVINSKEEYGGGFHCYKKKDGCGHNWGGTKKEANGKETKPSESKVEEPQPSTNRKDQEVTMEGLRLIGASFRKIVNDSGIKHSSLSKMFLGYTAAFFKRPELGDLREIMESEASELLEHFDNNPNEVTEWLRLKGND